MDIGGTFREFYADPGLRKDIREAWLPWLLDGLGPNDDPPVDLGDSAVELAAGPALRTGRVARSFDLDSAFDLPVSSAIVALLALHHFPDTETQDQALAYWASRLRPGGVLIGLNPIDGPHFRRLDVETRCTPIDPMHFAARLAKAGFHEVTVRVWSLVGFNAVI